MEQQLAQLSDDLGKFLLSKQWRLATAESCTGGWVSQVITATAGSSQWFERGFVTYSNQAKQDMLGVSARLIQEQGAVSEAVVVAMAEGALQHSEADMSLAITGIAGPDGGSTEKPVGTVCFAWAVNEQVTQVATQRFSGDRESIRKQAVVFSLQNLLAYY